MQATVVLLIALGGLGCQNPAADLPPVPSPAVQPAPIEPAIATPATEPAPPPYQPYLGASIFDTGEPPNNDSFGNCLRDTFCSFLIGRSPDVPSARQIEDAYRAGYYSR